MELFQGIGESNRTKFLSMKISESDGVEFIFDDSYTID
jgi:hypothetical protein